MGATTRSATTSPNTVLLADRPSGIGPSTELAPGALFAAAALVERAGRGLAISRATADPDERYALAHLAALRTAAAVLAADGPSAIGGRSRRRGPAVEVWQTLAERAPELASWSLVFSESAQRRQEVARGAQVAEGEADDLVGRAEDFLEGVLRHLGLPVRVRPAETAPGAVPG